MAGQGAQGGVVAAVAVGADGFAGCAAAHVDDHGLPDDQGGTPAGRSETASQVFACCSHDDQADSGGEVAR